MSSTSRTRGAHPNIIWIISDDTKHAELACTGGNVLSPNIDSIAANGVQFTNFHCVSPACTPSRYNYLTGHYGGRCPAQSFRDEIPDGEPYSLGFNTNLDPERETSLPRALRDAGYFTGFSGKWHTGAGTEDLAPAGKIDKSADPYDPATSKLHFEYGYQRALRSGKWKYIALRWPQQLMKQMKEGGKDVFFDFMGKPVNPGNIRPTVIVPLVPRIPHFFEPDQLYDLERDPEETTNLAGDPAYAEVLREMKQRLQERLDTFADPFQRHRRSRSILLQCPVQGTRS